MVMMVVIVVIVPVVMIVVVVMITMRVLVIVIVIVMMPALVATFAMRRIVFSLRIDTQQDRDRRLARTRMHRLRRRTFPRINCCPNTGQRDLINQIGFTHHDQVGAR
ncbi:MAG: hypothetical protein AAF709_05030 [Pseudomonadota bacterium]